MPSELAKLLKNTVPRPSNSERLMKADRTIEFRRQKNKLFSEIDSFNQSDLKQETQFRMDDMTMLQVDIRENPLNGYSLLAQTKEFAVIRDTPKPTVCESKRKSPGCVSMAPDLNSS